jgi:hypothetical protein
MQRHEFLNRIIQQYGFQTYLEIGCDTNRTFSRIKCPNKTGVDPRRGGTHRMTSDEFFADAGGKTWDLIFVDGLHHAEQVLNDVTNALIHRTDRGLIVLDDCWPKRREQQLVATPDGEPILRPPTRGPWTGDVWKAVVRLRQMPYLDTCVLESGWGFGVVAERPNTQPLLEPLLLEDLSWPFYEQFHRDLLRLVDRKGLDEFLADWPPEKYS